MKEMKKFFLYLKYFLKRILQNSLIAYIATFIILLSLKRLSNSKKKNAIKIIVFSDFRWQEGINILNRDTKIIIYKIPDIIVNYINSFFNAKRLLDYYLQNESYLSKKNKKEKILSGKPLSLHYFKTKDKKVLNERIKKEKFVKILVKNLLYFYKINCGASCGFDYSSEYDWISGFHNGGIPFVILYKEMCNCHNKHIKKRIRYFKEINYKFLGTAMGVINQTIRDEIKKSNLIPNTYIKDIGFLRFDNILKKRKRISVNKRKGITLFSFFPFQNFSPSNFFINRIKNSNFEIYNQHFSDKNKEGFAKLFLNTHKIFIKLAEKNKNTNFYLKFKFPDYLNDVKYKKILINFIKKVTGKDPKRIKNLILTNENSISLIKKSKNIISFNSSVIVESVACGVVPIVPIFDEAKGKYSENVFFKDDKYNIHFADTKKDFINLINLSLKNKIKLIQNKKNNDFLKRYINYTKPEAKTNTILFLKKVIAEYNRV